MSHEVLGNAFKNPALILTEDLHEIRSSNKAEKTNGPQSQNHKLQGFPCVCMCVEAKGKRELSFLGGCLSLACKVPSRLDSWPGNPRDPPASTSLELEL